VSHSINLAPPGAGLFFVGPLGTPPGGFYFVKSIYSLKIGISASDVAGVNPGGPHSRRAGDGSREQCRSRLRSYARVDRRPMA
jgi:hypothetical protein